VPGGLNKDGGISFTRKKNFSDKKKEPEMFSRKAPDKPDEEPEEEIIEEPVVLDPISAARQARLEAKLVTAKTVNYSGFAVNGSSMLVILVGVNNVIMDPSTLELIDLIETTFGIDIPYERFIELVESWKAHIMTLCGSVQMLFIYYQQIRQGMKDADTEDTWGFVNDELGKVI
tara:strand:+ start:43870 stop:44391 length:522 start_codon:yes stop_codon:yes gene_type:complete